MTTRSEAITERQKRKVLDEFRKAHPSDLSLKEVTKATGISRITASKYLGILKAEGKIEVSRRIGHVVLYRIREGEPGP